MCDYKQLQARQGALSVLRDASLEGKDRETLARLRSMVPSRDWHAEPCMREVPTTDVGPTGPCVPCACGSITIGECWSGQHQVTLINPKERAQHEGLYIFGHGAYGWTCTAVYASTYDDAIDATAEWLLHHAPGYVMQDGSDEHRDLVREACEVRGWSVPDDRFDQWVDAEGEPVDEEDLWSAQEDAESELIRTESGFLTSYELYVVAVLDAAKSHGEWLWRFIHGVGV